ncbi:unnamed protein product [Adineta steineri]|uniref:RRM domain-containing protein n=2 Tax=Adineta steineri TaxID=433720 RepID=A0A819D370_9BILA|nr:unnamed protein product [Adineta steineri]CAF3822260.1 unnamed protein product [Adineta steineri]
MSSISMDVPTFEINQNQIQNLIHFIYEKEQILKEYGAIKITLNQNCKLALKKRKKISSICETNKQIVKLNENNLIYSVKTIDQINQYDIKQNYLIKNENDFWSSLSSLKSNNQEKQLNISFLQNNSFFRQKISHKYFDIHRLPGESLLKIVGKDVLNKFVPCLKRAHGSGSVFPLTSADQHLFSIDYHHEGGDHHWYVIPDTQRESFKKILEQQNLSIGCFDHGQVFVDPLLLDKNQIRYHKIIQHPNEFVVLSSGTLAQSFTEDSSWSESINFALPSWIQDGHAYNSRSLCQCQISDESYLSKLIDMNLFPRVLVQKYINSSENSINIGRSILLRDETDVDMFTMSTANNISINSINEKTIGATNLDVSLLQHEILSTYRSPSSTLIIPSLSSHASEDDQVKFNDNNDQVQYELVDQGNFRNASDQKTSDIVFVDSIWDECLSRLDTDSGQIYQTTTASTNISDDFLLYEELMDILPFTEDYGELTRSPIHEYVNRNSTSTFASNTHTETVSTQNHVRTSQMFDPAMHDPRILFVSGLKKDVNKNNIRRHFIGCLNVTIRQCRTILHLKYAFIVHHTARDAAVNLRRPIDLYLLGPACHIEYANKRTIHASCHQSLDKKKILVCQIPPNVSENDLRQLFGNCHLEKYYPAVVISHEATMTKIKDDANILSGYAYILFDHEEQAAYTIEHANQYQINGQSLVLSLSRH